MKNCFLWNTLKNPSIFHWVETLNGTSILRRPSDGFLSTEASVSGPSDGLLSLEEALETL